MKRTSRTLTAVAASGLLAVTVAGTGSAEDNDAPSYKEFKAATYYDAQSGYVVNGDEPVGDQQELKAFYEELVAPPQTDGLIINRVYGVDDKWSATQARNLTYCVSTAFGSNYTAVKNAMANGAAQWEGASSGVNFTHVSTQDGSCTTRNSSVVFSVEPTTTTRYIARAFFPGSSKSARNVLVNARPLTPYDSASIMHYPQCNGSSSDLSMTSTDRAGVQSVYGS